MVHLVRVLGLCVALLGASTTMARSLLNIEITQGVEASVAIAVTPFLGESTEVAEVVQRDLDVSGRFSPFAVDELPDYKGAAQLGDSFWRGQNVDYVVRGSVKSMGGQRYAVQFSLTHTQMPQGQVLVEKSFTQVRSQDLRTLAHHISDIIFETVTHTRGHFATKIAYVMVEGKGHKRVHSLEVSDYDGKNAKRVYSSAEPLMAVQWAPDGHSLVYVSFEHKRAEIYRLNLNNMQRERLTHFPGINGAPRFSPTGDRLAVVLSKDGHPNLYVLDLQQRVVKRMTQGAWIDTEPTWSPDGRTLYFTSNRGGKPQIYSLELATQKTQRVTFVGNYNARPCLTLDGKTLVMIHQSEDGVFKIAKQDLLTGAVTTLTQARMDQSPSLSPNGLMVLYGTIIGGKRVLGAVSLDAQVHLRLPAKDGSMQEPAWSPFL